MNVEISPPEPPVRPGPWRWRRVDLRAGPGVRLLGSNGAGKTSLLRMMATAIPPNLGPIAAARPRSGSYGPRREIRRRLGYLPQNLGYYRLHGGGVRGVFRAAEGVPAALIPAAVAAAVERTGLGGKAKAKLRTLSGGMLRRVGVRQAIVNEPELLLLDEPTAGLDPEQRVAFRALLRRAGRARHRRGQHTPGRGRRSRLHAGPLMDQGKIVFQGTPATGPREPAGEPWARRRPRHRAVDDGAEPRRTPATRPRIRAPDGQSGVPWKTIFPWSISATCVQAAPTSSTRCVLTTTVARPPSSRSRARTPPAARGPARPSAHQQQQLGLVDDRLRPLTRRSIPGQGCAASPSALPPSPVRSTPPPRGRDQRRRTSFRARILHEPPP